MRGNVEIPEHLFGVVPPGPRIEFGVYAGDTLERMAEHPGETIGVDSFQGMAEPTANDVAPDGRQHYTKGKHAVSLSQARARVPDATFITGFVPEVLPEVPDGPYALVHLDMDQYHPTAAALEWAWDRMVDGGVIVAHDFYPDRSHLAAGALNEWRESHPETGYEGISVWWVR